ncbi:MAG: undecaprenyl-diphosphate phosphatase [Candidatus Paceibacterota bacterium]
MINYIQAILLGLLQGVTELFPISSLGHSVILPTILHWNIDQSNNMFVVFLIATHLATAIVLFVFFYKDWVLIIKGIFRSIKERGISSTDTYAKLGWLIIIASIPAGILGFLFEKKIKVLLASALITAIFLVINGLLLYGAEYLRKKSAVYRLGAVDAGIATLTLPQAIKVGFAQCLALIPGFSRTGATLGGGLLVGLTHEEAARFSFLLATPIIFAASILKLPTLIHTSSSVAGPIIVGAIASAIAAFFSIRFLTKYFKENTLAPFALYCIIAGLVAIAIIVM